MISIAWPVPFLTGIDPDVRLAAKLGHILVKLLIDLLLCQ
jgi:hypothetical protein